MKYLRLGPLLFQVTRTRLIDGRFELYVKAWRFSALITI